MFAGATVLRRNFLCFITIMLGVATSLTTTAITTTATAAAYQNFPRRRLFHSLYNANGLNPSSLWNRRCMDQKLTPIWCGLTMLNTNRRGHKTTLHIVPSRRSLYVMTATVSPEVSKSNDELDFGFDMNGTPLLDDEESWQLYNEYMNEIIKREFTHKKKIVLPYDDLVAVQAYLLNNSTIKGLPSPTEIVAGSRITMRSRLTAQKEAFMKKCNFTPAMYELYGRCLVYVNDFCAKNQVKGPSLPAWLKLRECGLTPRENAVSTFLYVLSSQGDDMKARNIVPYKEACVDVAIFHDLLFHPNEKTALVRIKALIGDGEPVAAETVLNTLRIKRNDTSDNHDDSLSFKRLRTYQPIFQYYCDTGSITSAFRLYQKMKNTPGVYLVAETYALLIAAAARYGWFRIHEELPDNVKSSLKNMQKLGFVASSGPALLDELCSDLAKDILELDEVSAAMIIDGLNDGFDLVSPRTFTTGWLSDISQWFHFLVRNRSPAKINHRFLVQRVSVDNSTALCPETGACLRLLTLSKQQRRNVHDSLLQMATFEQEKQNDKDASQQTPKRPRVSKKAIKNNKQHNAIKNNKLQDAKNASYAHKELSLFSDWLRYRAGDAFTAFIDGPNVAYYGHGDVRWSQVEQVLNKLEQMGENPLVIMPQKYLSPKFYLASLKRTQELSESDLAFAQKLVETQKMYVVPSSCLDDYYWMLSSVAEQKSHPKLQHVAANDASGRFPGLRPLLVTNDQMRDHRLSLLEPRLFRRWTSCHIVKYHIATIDQSEDDIEEVTLFPADFFSREIQCNKGTRFGDNTAWHFPITEWPEPDRLCVTVVR